MNKPTRSVTEGVIPTRSASESMIPTRSVSEGQTSLPLRVVKVGGSLLTWPELPQALRSWLAERPAGINVLICGGGALVDALRETDGTLHLSQRAMHRLAIDAMSITARLLAT